MNTSSYFEMKKDILNLLSEKLSAIEHLIDNTGSPEKKKEVIEKMEKIKENILASEASTQ